MTRERSGSSFGGRWAAGVAGWIGAAFVATSLVAASPARAETFFVDPAGDDTWDGLAETHEGGTRGPFGTVQRAVDAVGPGDTILLGDGDYPLAADGGIRISTLGTAAEPITMRAANPHAAHISMPTTMDNAVIHLGIYRDGMDTRDNPFYWTFEGLSVEGGFDHGFQITGASYVTVRGCRVFRSGRDAIKVNHTSNHVLLEGNELFETGQRDDTNAEGIDVTSSDYVVIRGNVIHDTTTYGLYVKKDSRFGLVEQNVIYDAWGGISLGESSPCTDSIARNNLLVNIQNACLQGSGATRCSFLNNTCYDVANVGRAALRAGSTDDGLGNTELRFINNIVVMRHDTRFLFQATSSSVSGIDDVVLDHNLYFNLDASGAQRFSFQGHVEESLAEWQAWSAGQSASRVAQDESSLYADPMVATTDRASADFLQLVMGSPAVDVGRSLPSEVPVDFLGLERPIGAAFDIGAFELDDGTGVRTDGGVGLPDAGLPLSDGGGGLSDGGSGAGSDAGGGASEAGGCGCRVPAPRDPSRSWLWGLVPLVGLLLLRRR